MTDTQFDRLAELTQEAVDALKQAIERAEAAELQLSREAMQVAELMLEVRTLRKQRDEFRDEVEQLNRELSKAWYHRYRTPGTKADRKPSWTRADGSTNPRTGERRKVDAKRCDTCIQPCTSSQGHCYYNIRGYLHDNCRDPSGANDRRRNK